MQTLLRGISTRLWRAALVGALAASATLFFSSPVALADDGEPPEEPERPPALKLKYPRLDTGLNRMVEEIAEAPARTVAAQAPLSRGELVAVTVRLSDSVSSTARFLAQRGAIVANAGKGYIETYVPISLLPALAQRDGVLRVGTIVPPQADAVSQGAAVHGARPWNARGLTGAGVKVGVLDVGFIGYAGLMGTELPPTVVARCYTTVGVSSPNLAKCQTFSVHGTAVSEAIADIAPDVTMYISNPLSAGDLQSSAAWMVSQGVQVINMSLAWTWDGPGDGTSPLADSPLNTLDQAVSGGAMWATARGTGPRVAGLGHTSTRMGTGGSSSPSAPSSTPCR